MNVTNKEISFGKIDYYRSGRCINEITLSIRIRYSDKKELSICGNIWNGNHTDVVSSGQCLDEIYEYRNELKNAELFDELYFYWKKYHLKTTPDDIIIRVKSIIKGDFEKDGGRRARIALVFEAENV